MPRNSGKLFKRNAHFKPPALPRSDQLSEHQKYGVITKYHGGWHRNMNVTIYDGTHGLVPILCRLKGSLRHFKCGQKCQPGLYCMVTDDVVTIIFRDAQLLSIPSDIFTKLSLVARTSVKETDSTKEETVFMDDDVMSSNELENDEDIVFDDPVVTVSEGVDNIDTI